MSSPEEDIIVTRLEQINKASSGLLTSVETFEQATREAAVHCEKYVGPKKAGPPMDPPSKQIEQFKKTITAHDTAANAMMMSVTQQAGVLTALKFMLDSDLEAVRDMDPADRPEALKVQIAAMQNEVQRQGTERAEEQSKLHKQMEEIQEECNAEKKQLLEQHVVQVNELQKKLEAALDEKEINGQKLLVEKEAVEKLLEVVAARDARITELLAKGDALEAEAAINAQGNKEIKHDLDVLQAQMNVSEASRLNDANAYRKSVEVNTLKIENLKRSASDGIRQAEVAKTEREAMRARLVDDHLREHIRVLQEENNHLREEKIKLAHDISKRTTTSTNVSGVLSAQLAEYHAAREQLERKVRQLQEEAAGSDKVIFDLSTTMDQQRSESTAAIEALNTQLQREKMVATERGSPPPLQGSAAATQRAAPRVHRAIATQATDEHWKQLEKDLIYARATNIELSDRTQAMERYAEEQRRNLEAKLLSEAENSSAQVSSMSSQLKACRYKNAKLQQQVTEASDRTASINSELHADPYQAADEKLIERCGRLEKQAVAASLEAESLKIRLRTVTRELHDQRTNDVVQQQSYPIAAATSPKSSSPTFHPQDETIPVDSSQTRTSPAMSPRSSQAMRLANERAQRQADIDQQLLQLHEESIVLDEKERVVQERRTTSERQIKDRLNWIEGTILYWCSNEVAHQPDAGPEGESKEEMVQKLLKEKEDLKVQLEQVEKGIVKFFQEVSDRRGKLFARSTQLLEDRARM